MLFKGSGVAIVTPFNESGEIDLLGLEKLIEFQLENQTDAIIINGTTGESSTLSKEERLATIKHTVKVVNKRVPVIAGTGSNNTLESAAFSKEVAELGVDGLLVVTPYYNRSSKRGLYEHFKVIAEAVSIPVILYNVPGRTSVTIPVETIVELAKIENVVGLKDATGDLAYTTSVHRLTPDHFAIYSGNDDLIVPVLSVGGVGVISVAANIIPLDMHMLVSNYLAGKTTEAAAIQAKYQPLIDALFIETNPIPIKAALEMMDLPAGGLRLPLFEAEEATKAVLRERMKEVGL